MIRSHHATTIFFCSYFISRDCPPENFYFKYSCSRASACLLLTCLIILRQILPVNIKGFAGSLATLLNWLMSWAVTMTANILLNWSSAGKSLHFKYISYENLIWPIMTQILVAATGTFTIYGVVCACLVAFVTMLVPETKGRTLEEIQASFR